MSSFSYRPNPDSWAKVMHTFSIITWWIRHFFLLQIVEEAGGMVSRMDGGEFTVFDRSVLVSNGVVHDQVCS